MLHADYIVIKRDGQWWTTMDGNRTGPYGSDAEAIRGAIVEAKTYERAGHTATVTIDEPSGFSIVYDTEKGR